MKPRLKNFIVAIVLLSGIVTALGIALNKRQGNDGTAIRLASILILSGGYSSYGEQFRDGAQLAVKDANSTGSQQPVEVVFYDSGGSKQKTKELVQTLHDRDNIKYLADIMGTGLALEAASSFNSRKMLTLSGVNTGPELSWQGGNFFFRIIPSDGVAAAELSRWAIELGLTRGVLVHDVDDWGKGLATEMKQAYAAGGGQLVDTIECQKGLQILAPLASRISAAEPQVVFLLVYPREAGLLLREARNSGVTARFMGTDNFTGSELLDHAREAADGVYFVVPGAKGSPTPSAQRLQNLYRNSHGDNAPPPLFTVMAYDVVTILADLARRFGDDTLSAANYLRTATYKGASGPIRFEKNGDVRVTSYRRMEFKKNAGGKIEANSLSTD